MAWRSRHLGRLALSTALSAGWVVPAAAQVVVPKQGDIASTTLPAKGLPVVVTPTTTGSTVVVPVGRTIINWNKFNIQGKSIDGTPATTAFTTIDPTNPASAVLNRVVGGGATTIDGVLTAPSSMQLFILNSAGVLFGTNAKITAGSLIASTRNMLDQSFLDGKFAFLDQQTNLGGDQKASPGSGAAGGDGQITVEGAATLLTNGVLRDANGVAGPAGTGGLYLIGARVAVTPTDGNTPSITASGDAAFVAADEVEITPSVGSPLSIRITQGTSVPDAIKVSGTISGESVTLALASRDGLINTLTAAGSLDATNAAGGDGGVVLLADAGAAAVSVPGTSATATKLTSTINAQAQVTSKSGYTVAARDRVVLGGATAANAVTQTAADAISLRSDNSTVSAAGPVSLQGAAGAAGQSLLVYGAGGVDLTRVTIAPATDTAGPLAVGIGAGTGQTIKLGKITATSLDGAAAGVNGITPVDDLSATGTLTFNGAVSVAKALTIRSTGAVTGTDGSVQSDDALSVTGTGVSLSGVQGSRVSVQATDPNGEIALGRLVATGTGFATGFVAASATVAASPTGTGGVTIGTASTASGGLDMSANGTLKVTQATSVGTLTLHATTGDALIGSAQAGTPAKAGTAAVIANLSLDTARSIAGVDGGTAAFGATGTVSLTTSGAARLGTVAGDGGVSLTAGSIDAGTLRSSGGTLSATATGTGTTGGIVIGTAETDATGFAPATAALTVGGQAAVTVTQASTGSGTLAITTPGAVTAITVNAGGPVTLAGGSVAATTLSAGGAIGIKATKSAVTGADGSVTLGLVSATPGVGTVTGPSDLVVTADAGATIRGAVDVDGDYTVTAAGVTLGTAGVANPVVQQAGGAVTVTARTNGIAAAGRLSLLSDKNKAGGHALTLEAQGGDITGAPTLSGGDGKSAVAVIAPLAKVVTLGAITGSELLGAKGATGVATGGALTVGDIKVGGAVSLDTLDATGPDGAAITTGSITAGAGGIGIAASGTATVAGAVSTAGAYSVRGASVVLGRAVAAGGDPILQAAGGAITLRSTTGTIGTAGPVTLRGTAGAAGQSLLVYGAGGVDLSGAAIDSAASAGPLMVGVGAGTGQTVTLGAITADTLGGAGLAGGVPAALATLGASNTLTFGGVVQVNKALTVATTDGANIVVGQGITSKGDLSLTAAGGLDAAGTTLEGRTVTAVAQGSDLALGTLTAQATGLAATAVTGRLTAKNDVTVGTASSQSGTLFLDAGGTLTLGTAKAGGGITLSAMKAALVDEAHAGLGGAGDLTLSRAQNVASRTGDRALFTAAGTLSLKATDALLLGASSGNAGVVLNAGSIDATSLTSAAGTVGGSAKGLVTVGTLTTDATGFAPTKVAASLQGGDVTVDLVTLKSGALSLTTDGTLTLGTANVGGAITLSAGKDALVDEAHAGLGGAGDLTLTRAQNVTNRAGGRAVFTAAGTSSLTATNALLLGAVSGDAGVVLNAGSIDATSLTSAAGTIGGGAKGLVKVGTVTTNAAGLDPANVAASLQGGDVTVDLATLKSGALSLTTDGTLTLGTANVGGAITLSAGKNALVDEAHAGLGGAGNLTLTKAQDVTSRTGGRVVFTAAGTLSLTATDALLLGAVSGDAGVVLNAGSIDATSLTSAAGTVGGSAKGLVKVGSVTTNATGFAPAKVAASLQGGDVTVGSATLKSGALSLDASGTLMLGTANVGGAITLAATNNALVDEAHAGLGGAGDLTLTKAQNVTSPTGGRAVFTAAGTLSLTVTDALLLGAVSGNAGVALDAGSVDATSLGSAGGSIQVLTRGSATLGEVNAKGGVALTTTAGGGGAITLGTLTAGGNASVQADGAALVSGTVTVTGGDYRVAGRTVELGSVAAGDLGPAQSATGAVEITAVTGITGRAGLRLTSDSDATGAEALTLATRAATGGVIDLTGTTLLGGRDGGSDVRIAAGSAGDRLVLGDVRARGLLGAITTDPAPAFAPGLSRTGPLTVGTVTIAGPLILASGDRLTAQALTGGSLSLTAGNGADVGALTATAGDLSLLSNGGLFDLTAGATARAGSIRLDGAGGFRAAGDLDATGGDIRLAGTGGFGSAAGLVATVANGVGGTISIERAGDFAAGSLSATGDLSIGQAVRPASVTVSGTTAVGGALAARIAGAARFGDVGAGGPLSVAADSLSAGTVTAGGALTLATTQGLSAASVSGTEVSLSGGSLSVTDLVEARTGAATLSTLGALAVGRLRAAGAATVGAGTATIGTVDAATVQLAATAGGLDLGRVTAGGDAALTATGDIRVDQAAAGGRLSLQAGGDVTGRAQTGGGYGDAALFGGAGVSVSTADAGDEGGTIQVASIAGDGDIGVTGRVLTLGTVVSNRGAVTLAARDNGTATRVSLSVGTVDAATTATLSAGAGSGPLAGDNGAVRVDAATARNGALVVTAAGSVSARDGSTGTTLVAGGAAGDGLVSAGTGVRIATITAGRDIGVTAGGGGQDGAIAVGTAQAARDLRLQASAVTPGAGGIQVGSATAASLSAQTLGTPAAIILGPTRLAGDLQLQSTGDVVLADPVVAGGAATIAAAGALQAADLAVGQGFTADAGTAAIGRLQAGGDLSLTAGTVTGTDLLSTGGAARIAATGGDLALGRLRAAGDVTLSATGAARLGAITGNALTVTAANLSLDTGSAAGPALLSIAGAADIGSLSGAGISATVGTLAARQLAAQGDLAVRAAGDIQLTAATATGAIGLTGGGAATLGTLASGGALRVDAGSVTLTDGRAGGAATVTAAGAAGVTSLAAATDLSLSGASVRAGLLAAGTGALAVTATGGDLTLDAGTAGAAAALFTTGRATVGTLGVGGPLSIRAASLGLNTATAGGNATVDVDGDAAVTSLSSGGDIGATVGGALQAGTLEAAGGITAAAGTLALGTVRADAGPVSLRATGGTMSLTDGRSGGAVTLSAAGALQVAQLATPAIASLSGASVTLGTATLGGLDLKATGGDATIDTADVTGDTALASTGGLAVRQRLTTGGALVVQAGGSFTAATLASGGDQSVTAGTVSIDAAQAGGAITLISTAGPLSVGTATAGGAATFTSAGDLSVDELSAATATLAATGAARIGTLRTTSGPTTLIVGTAFTATSLDASGDLAIQATDVTLGRASAGGGLRVAAAGGLTADSLSSGGDARLDAGTLTVGIATIGGALNATTRTGLLRFDTAQVSGPATLAAAGDARIGSLATGGLLSLTAGGNATIGTADAGGDATLSVTGDLTVSQRLSAQGAATLRAGGGIVAAILASGGDQSVTGANVAIDASTSGGALLVSTTGGPLRIGDATAQDAATLTSADALSVGQLSAATATLASAGTTQVGALRTTGGPATLTAGTSLAATTLDASGDLAIQATDVTLGRASAGRGLRIAAAGGLTTDSLSSGGDAEWHAGTLTVGTTTIGGALTAITRAGLLRLDTAQVGGPAPLSAAGDAQIGSLVTGGPLALTAAGNAKIGAADGGSDATLSVAGDLTVSQRLSAQGAATLRAGGGIVAATLASGGDQSVTGANVAIDASTSGGALLASTTGGPLRIGGATAQGGATLTSADALTVDQLSAATATLASAGTTQVGTLRTTGGPATLIAGTALSATALDASGDLAIKAADVALGQASAGGGLRVAAAGGLTADSLSSGGDAGLEAATLTVGTATIGGALTAATRTGLLGLDAAQVGGAATLSAGGDTRIGSLTAGGDLSLTANGDAALGTLAATQGTLALGAGGGVTAGVLSAAGDATVTAGTDAALDTLTVGGMLAASAGGALSLRTASVNGDATLMSSGDGLLSGALTVGGALTASARTLTLGDAGGAATLQQAGRAITLAAAGGAITGRAGLTLRAATGDIALTAAGGGGSLAFDGATRIEASIGSVTARTAGSGAFGTIVAGGASVALTAADLTLAGPVSAPAIQLANGSPDRLTILGDAPAGVAEYGAGSAATFALDGGELARLQADRVVVDAGTGAVRMGDLALTADAGRTSFQVATAGRMDLLGGLTAAGSGDNRTIILGGDAAAGRATVLRVAATAAAGGRIDVAGATLDLRADNIAVGLDAGFNTALGTGPGGTPIAAGQVASRYVAQPFSSLYNATLGTGGTGYTNPTLLTAGRLVVRYSGFALFQNTGLAGIDTGLVLGGGGSGGPALSLQPATSGGNAFAFFGTVNGIGGTATSLLGNDVLAVGTGVSRPDSRANGCPIGAAGSGCLASNLVQPNLNLFDVSRADVFRSAEDLTLPFEPLVSTNNEALFSDIASLDQAGAVVPCAPGTTYCPTPGAER